MVLESAARPFRTDVRPPSSLPRWKRASIEASSKGGVSCWRLQSKLHSAGRKFSITLGEKLWLQKLGSLFGPVEFFLESWGFCF